MNAADLVRTFGSPLYVYELDDLRRAVRQLAGIVPAPARLLYSAKANPHPGLLAELHQHGCGVEISSAGELTAALTAGVPAAECLHNGPSKTVPEIEEALRAGVRSFSVDSAAQLGRLDRLAAAAGLRADVLLRVNGNAGAGRQGLAMTGTASQFGIDLDQLTAEPGAFSGGPGARVTGLHFYLGTNVFDETDLLATFRQAIELASSLRGMLPEGLRTLDLGGGFGSPYARHGDRPSYPALRAQLTSLLDEHLDGWRTGEPGVIFESGRFLAGACGRLLATVQDVKVSKGRTFVLLDAGINHLGGMAGLRRVPPLVPDLVTGPELDRAPAMDRCDVVGPLCTPLDAWARGVSLPELWPGDLVEVPNVGAYGLTGSLVGFLSHPAPVEVVTDRGVVAHASQIELIRTATGRDITHGQHQ